MHIPRIALLCYGSFCTIQFALQRTPQLKLCNWSEATRTLILQFWRLLFCQLNYRPMCGLYAIAYHFYLRRAVTASATCHPGATRTHTRGRNRTSGVNGYKPYPITTWVLSLNRPSAVSALFIVLLLHYSVICVTDTELPVLDSNQKHRSQIPVCCHYTNRHYCPCRYLYQRKEVH